MRIGLLHIEVLAEYLPLDMIIWTKSTRRKDERVLEIATNIQYIPIFTRKIEEFDRLWRRSKNEMGWKRVYPFLTTRDVWWMKVVTEISNSMERVFHMNWNWRRGKAWLCLRILVVLFLYLLFSICNIKFDIPCLFRNSNINCLVY